MSGIEPAAYAHYEHETWSEMYICQPPIAAISYEQIECSSIRSVDDVRCTAYNPAGLTNRDLLHCENTVLRQKINSILDAYEGSSQWELYYPHTNEQASGCIDGPEEMDTCDGRSTAVSTNSDGTSSGKSSENDDD